MGALEGSGKETSITMNQLKVISVQYFSGNHNTEEEVIPTIFRLTKNYAGLPISDTQGMQ